MAALDLVQGQIIQIPAIQLTDGQVFIGVVRAAQGDTIAIELDAESKGVIPQKIDSGCVLTWKVDGVQRACPVLVRSKSQRAMVVQMVLQERREAPRLRAEIRLIYEVVPTEQVTMVAEEVMAKINPLDDPISETVRLLRAKDDPLEQIHQEIAGLRATLEIVMAKLDQLTTLISSNDKNRTGMLTVKKPLALCNTSSTGLGFLCDEQYEHGQYLRLHLTLCTTPQVEIDCMGVVVRCKRLEEDPCDPAQVRFDTGVRYTHIHESDREHLIHYLFKVQRRILRDMKEARMEIASGTGAG